MNIYTENMLKNTSDEYDKQEGSLFHDCYAPMGEELLKSYDNADFLFRMANPLTAENEYLDKAIKGRIGDRVVRKLATKAVGKVTISGIVGTIIEAGTKVACEDIIFKVLNNAKLETENVTVDIECMQAGTIGNLPAKAINSFPVTIQGLQSVINEEPTINGFEQESDKDFLERYLIMIREPAISGNKYEYKQLALAVAGVGAVKVFPLWNGNGTVKVVIADTYRKPPNQELITSVSNYINDLKPIGATLTVVGATNLDVTINAEIVYMKGAIIDNIVAEYKTKVETFFRENAFKQENEYISIAKLGEILLNTTNVLDYRNLKINGSSANIVLNSEQIANLTIVNLTNFL